MWVIMLKGKGPIDFRHRMSNPMVKGTNSQLMHSVLLNSAIESSCHVDHKQWLTLGQGEPL